jgi:hypothetical protein
MTETPAQYEIKSLSDFLNVPAEKLPECLGDFEQWVALRRSMADGFKLLEPLFGDLSAAVEMKDAFIWLDDGLSGFSQINIVCGEEQIGTLSLTTEGSLPTRHDLQKEGKHPAPCARFCEATAFEIEIRRLRTEAQGAAATKAALSQFYNASKELIDSGGSPEACRKFDDAEAKVLAIIGIVEQDTKTREDHPK